MEQEIQSQAPVKEVEIVSNNLVWAILVTILCCLPGGIYAIVLASRVDGLVAVGKTEEAKATAKKSLNWSIYSAIAGGVCMIAYVLILVVFEIGMQN